MNVLVGTDDPILTEVEDGCSFRLVTAGLDLTGTGPTFAEWLEATQQMHEFLTGETVNLLDMFDVPEETLERQDIMPVFRPQGATNREALDQKVELGMVPAYEQVEVMRYGGSRGPRVPQLCYINRSIRPDEATFGKSSDTLAIAKDITWIDLGGWSTADDLHYSITGKHLDSQGTVTLFPKDRIWGNKIVASACWRVGRSWAAFYGRSSKLDLPNFGGRRATPFQLRP